MYIKDIRLINYRNYTDQSFCFSEGLNVIYGDNASGKTNLVEAVLLSSIGKSLRTSRDKDLINWDFTSCSISITLSKKYRDYKIDISIDSSGKKSFFLDRVPITKIADLMGIINVVFFSPDELAIIKESPVERRRFMDIAISQQKKSYFTDLIDYNRILDQRNKALKTYHNHSSLRDILPIWDIQLAKIGTRIINNRYIFIDKLKERAAVIHSSITNAAESLTLSYESKLSRSSCLIMEDDFLSQLTANIDKDIKLSYTQIGPHRDDISIISNNIDVRKFGSQGQQRTAALSLILSEISVIEAERGEKPILILDDVLSELDSSRCDVLLSFSHSLQTLLTSTSAVATADKLIHISHGKSI